MDSQRIRSISYDFLRVCIEFMELDHHTHFYGTDVKIYPAEVHLISAIAENSGIHVMGLAQMRGVTKGTISQMIRKLEHKGLVEKKVSEENQSKLCLYLTEKGKCAHEHHMLYHKKLDEMFEKELVHMSEEELICIEQFLKNTLEKVKGLEKEL